MFLCHHQIDGQTNPKLQSVFLERFPIHTAHFSSDGEQVILASQRRSFYVYDMIKGEVIKIPEIRGIDDLSYTTIGLVFISQRFLRLWNYKSSQIQLRFLSAGIQIFFVKMLCNKWKVLLCIFDLFFAGREERYFDKFHVSPDGKHLIFLGTNGYIILLSSKVSLLPYNQSTCMRSAKAPWPITKTLPKINKFVIRVPVIIAVIT